MSAIATHVSTDRLLAAFRQARNDLLAQRTEEGYWIGELSTSSLSTATASSALSLYLQNSTTAETADEIHRGDLERLRDGALVWLVDQQNEDGGWGDTDQSYSNISTTMLVVAAFHLAQWQDRYAPLLQRANTYIENKGGIDGLRRRYGKDKTFAVPILTNYALAGLVPWRQVSPLPFEAACVPQSWYRFMQLPVVSYAIPALVAIGHARYVHLPPRNPLTRLIRRMSVQKSLDVLLKMQPESGGYLEAIPLTSFVVMGLASTGQANHPVVRQGLRFICESVREDGSWPIDTNLATWTTTLSINALADSEAALAQVSSDSTEADVAAPNAGITAGGLVPQSCLNWLLACQHDFVHPFTGAAPGGWAWTDLSGGVPDSDDTPGALLALKHCHTSLDASQSSRVGRELQTRIETRERIENAVELGICWLLDLQNRDGGWPTFCRGWGRLPFDRSGSDLTAHVIRALAAWQHIFDSAQINRAIDTGFSYLKNQQRHDGSWVPLWFGNQDETDEENPVYGTAKVLLAYRDTNRFDTSAARRGLSWLVEHQNDDGGWGGGAAVAGKSGSIGSSSIEETALATEALATADPGDRFRASCQRGVAWLVSAVESNFHAETSPIGFYFAKLWYYEKLYPLIFTSSALRHALQFRVTEGASLPPETTHEPTPL